MDVRSSCRVISMIMYKSDLRDGYNKNSVGGTFESVPFYDADSGDLLGSYSDSAVQIDDDDCIGSGAFSFGSGGGGDTPSYSDQVEFGFTCSGRYNAVTGGTGTFGCATGFEQFVVDDGTVINSNLYVCGTLCPFPPPLF